MTKIKAPRINPQIDSDIDYMKLLNFRARKLQTILSEPDIVNRLKLSCHYNFTIRETKEMVKCLIYASRKEMNETN